MQGWFIVIIAIAYVTLLFAIASLGDRALGAFAAGPGAALHLRAQPRHLLHLLDLLRLGRPVLRARPRIPRHLYRPGAGVRVRLSAAQPHRAAGQDREDHLDRRLPRRALRQELHRRGDRHADRHHRRGALYRAAAEGDLRLGQPDGRALHRLAALLRSVRQRHLAGRGHAAGAVCRAVRHPPCRRHRASGRAGAGGRGRNRGQARRLPGDRPDGHLPALRRPGRHVRQAGARMRRCGRRWATAPRSAPGWC